MATFYAKKINLNSFNVISDLVKLTGEWDKSEHHWFD